jgi:acyl-CoA:acyl-CoA alkyltransferase
MRFENVSILSVESVDAPHRIASRAITARLRPTLDRLGIKVDLLNDVAGVKARRFFDAGVQPSEIASQAANQALEAAGIGRSEVEVLVNTSVCRDFLEPATACLVHQNLGLSPNCLNFDLGNACLAFLNGMQVVATMIEKGSIDYGLVVDGEHSRHIIESTMRRLLTEDVDAEEFHSQFASLTLGSGAAAMVMGRADRHPDAHRFVGVVNQAATHHSHLCRGTHERMDTDARGLLKAGVDLAQQTWALAESELGWTLGGIDEFILHQVSQVHTAHLTHALRLEPKRVLPIFAEYGNVGPAAVPIALTKAVDLGRVQSGSRVALMGIGSGLNCTMAEVVW